MFGFQRTYEELKHAIGCKKIAGVPVFSVPMRNWNKLHKSKSMKLSSVFSVPMRNWNSLNSASSGTTKVGFQRTYEELKQVMATDTIPADLPFSAYLWGIETGQTHMVITGTSLFSAYLWGIETPIRWKHTLESNFVFSVPMRNWNTDTRVSAAGFTGFSAYLWGIETTVSSGTRPGSITVFSVPMRNWNDRRCHDEFTGDS